jgi:hypothetical protein
VRICPQPPHRTPSPACRCLARRCNIRPTASCTLDTSSSSRTLAFFNTARASISSNTLTASLIRPPRSRISRMTSRAAWTWLRACTISRSPVHARLPALLLHPRLHANATCSRVPTPAPAPTCSYSSALLRLHRATLRAPAPLLRQLPRQQPPPLLAPRPSRRITPAPGPHRPSRIHLRAARTRLLPLACATHSAPSEPLAPARQPSRSPPAPLGLRLSHPSHAAPHTPVVRALRPAAASSRLRAACRASALGRAARPLACMTCAPDLQPPGAGQREGGRKDTFGWSCRPWGKKKGTTDKEEKRRRRNGVLPRTYTQF